MSELDYNTLSLEEIAEEIRRLMEVARKKGKQEPKVTPEEKISTRDPKYYLDEDSTDEEKNGELEAFRNIQNSLDEEDFTYEEKNGKFDKYSEDELNASGTVDMSVVREIAGILTGDKFKGSNTREEALKSEIRREKNTKERAKELLAINFARAKVRAKIFSLNARAAASATKRTIGDKVKNYANDYEAKKIAIEKCNAALDLVDKKAQEYYESIEAEIDGLHYAEQSQTMRISGYVNAKNKEIQKHQDSEKEVQKEMMDAWKSGDGKAFEQVYTKIAKELKEHNEKLNSYKRIVKEETVKLKKIQANVKTREDELKRNLEEYKEQQNKVLARIEENRDKELTRISKQNPFKKIIGKVFSKIFASKAKRQEVDDSEQKLNIVQEYLTQVESALEQSNEEREAREEQYDRDFWADDEEIEEEPTWMDRFEESRQSIMQKSEQNKQKRAEVRAERRRLKVEKQNREMDERIEKARQKLEKLQSKQMSYNRTPVAEGR